MSVEYRFDQDWNCLVVRIFGALTSAQTQALFKATMELPEIAPHHLRLTDLREVISLPPREELHAIAHLSDRLDQSFPPKRSALVADSDLAYGIARVFAALREPDDGVIRVCRNILDAMEWLGLPVSAGDPFAPGMRKKEPVFLIE